MGNSNNDVMKSIMQIIDHDVNGEKSVTVIIEGGISVTLKYGNYPIYTREEAIDEAYQLALKK